MKIIKEHCKSIEEVANQTKTDLKSGLSSNEAQERLSQYGKNILEKGDKVSALKILFHNLNNIIVYLLISASILAFIMGDTVEGVAVIIAILIAVLSGFVSEYKAQKSVESLQSMVKTVTKVKRDNQIIEISSENLVVGDIIFIEEGDSITADARIIMSKNFATIESALTGESEAVEKDYKHFSKEDTSLGDRKNMVYTGTAATRGNAYAIVTQTGMNTEIGKISGLMREQKKAATPLEEQLKRLGKTLIIFSAIVSLIVVLVGILTGYEVYYMIKIGIILAIAAVPEALPAVSTITLAIGMKTMSNHNALVKNLPAVETLGSTTVICTDKTGTLTENQMTVKEIVLSDGIVYKVEGSGYNPDGKILKDDKEILHSQDKNLNMLMVAGALSSNAVFIKETNDYRVIGDPTEGGIIVMAIKAGVQRKQLESNGYERIGEIPFNSTDKFMATAYVTPNDKSIYIKGAPDVLIEMSKADKDIKEQWLDTNKELAGKGMRVLGIAQVKNYQGDVGEDDMKKALNQGIEILGFVGIIDPPREDVVEAVSQAQNAGIRIIMITGDHPETARIIAEKIGMKDTINVITGKQMDKMTDKELAEKILNTSIFARVSPENKLQIVNALNIDNEVTAMTGDGVNDAPALSGADIGVAMGIRGTEVAKEASDMILTDDKFSTIVRAIKEGRVIFDNIEKFVYFLFSCNVVEILAVLLTIVLRLPMPVLALQILWLNLVVDVMPAMSLAWEKGEKDVMQRKPRDPKQAIINRPFLLKILINGALISFGAVAVFILGLRLGYSEEVARTMAFSTMAFGQLFHILNVRGKSIFGIDKSFLKNKFMIIALAFSVVLQLIAVYVPFFNTVMGTAPLKIYEWGFIVLGSFIPTAIIQSFRLIMKKVKERSKY